MPYMQLPPGNRSVKMYDGTRYVAPREGGRVHVEDHHVSAINAVGGNGTAGLLTAGFREFTRSKRPGRVCTRCSFVAYAWSLTCPRTNCGAPTEPEQPPLTERPDDHGHVRAQ